MEVMRLERHACRECEMVIFDHCDKFVKSAKAFFDIKDQLEKGTFGFDPPPATNQGDGNNMAERGTLFDVTLRELYAGAEAGCSLFNWIIDDEWISRETIHNIARRDMIVDDPNHKPGWVFRDTSLWFEEWLGEPCPENTLRNIRPSLGDSLNQCLLWASTFQGTGNPLDIQFIRFFGLWDPVTQKIVYRTRHGFQVFTKPGTASASTVSNRPIASHPGSSTNLERMYSWLKDCQEHHNCKPMLGVMPTRLIEITGTADIISLRLRQTEEVGRVPFAALSYCWGGEQPMKCLSSNIVSYRTEIPFEKQPQTIIDAVKVCQGMRLQYLWVDALCIIQDDANDKSVEIAKMTSIYGSATVTIAAARSSSASDGFLGERFPGPREAAMVPYRCIDGKLSSITLVKLHDEFYSVEPIDKRGWTLQERLVSTRIIEFGSWQTRWICPETRSSKLPLETFADGWRRDVNFSTQRMTEALDLENIRAAKSTLDFYGRPRNSQFKEHSNAMQHWQRICATFTERALTLSSDRALAISGIAQIFAELSGDTYIAGLWKSCFHSGLLWRIGHNLLKHDNISLPTTYQGPSWSWLSVNGPVHFSQVCKPSECVAEILSCEAEPANEAAPYGLIREGSGRLVLAARTAVGVRKMVPLTGAGKFKDELLILGLGESTICYANAQIHCDIKDTEIDKDEAVAGCVLVEISRRSVEDKLSHEGLVLRWSSPERKTYSRLGRFSFYNDRKGLLFNEYIRDGQSAEVEFDWFADEPRIIEII